MSFTKNVKIRDEELTIKVGFYGNNNMPAILAMDEYDREYGVMTTNLNQLINQTISIRSDDSHHVNSLIESGWIKDHIVHSQPSGFIYINYYELTDEAYAEIKNAAIEQDVTYPFEY